MGKIRAFSESDVEFALQMVAVGTPFGAVCKELRCDPVVLIRTLRSDKYIDRFREADEASARASLDETVAIADDQMIDPAHKRYMIETRQKRAKLLDPSRYSEQQRIDVQHTVNGDLAQRLAEHRKRKDNKQLSNNDTQVIDITPHSDDDA